VSEQLSLDDVTPDPSPLAAVPLLDLLDWVADPAVADEVRRRLAVADTVCPCCARPLGDFDAPGTTGRNHPDTSRAAGEVKRGSERARVLLAVHWSADGRTADEIAQATYGNPNQVGARLRELHLGGYVTYLLGDDGRPVTRPTRSGREGRVHVLTPTGRAKAWTLDRAG